MYRMIKTIDFLVVILFYGYRNGFQKLDKIKDSNRQSKQLEDLTGKMRECKRYALLCFLIPFIYFQGPLSFEAIMVVSGENKAFLLVGGQQGKPRIIVVSLHFSILND